jgi:peptidoglycan/LPS O-acetylase OafA/YrhL
MKQKDYPLADWGDYLKLTACTAVILQSVLGLAINLPLSKATQVGIGFTYDLVKFTAPAFIFGILFTTIRLRTVVKQSYWQYLRQQWSALFLPSICWTIIYLVGLPQLQQIQHYHNFSSFIWQFFNGNAAPHLWYNTMMLQFIILMPLFWWLAAWCRQRPARAWLTVIVTVVFAGSWLLGYQYLVGSRPRTLVLARSDLVELCFICHFRGSYKSCSIQNCLLA